MYFLPGNYCGSGDDFKKKIQKTKLEAGDVIVYDREKGAFSVVREEGNLCLFWGNVADKLNVILQVKPAVCLKIIEMLALATGLSGKLKLLKKSMKLSIEVELLP